MSLLVVDASVALKWFFEEEDTWRAEQLAASDIVLIAPKLIRTEIANALWKKRRIGAVDLEGARYICGCLPDFFSELSDEEPLLSHALALSFSLSHPIYDCLYLSLAYERKCPLLTADRRLLNTADGQPDTPKLLPLSHWRP